MEKKWYTLDRWAMKITLNMAILSEGIILENEILRVLRYVISVLRYTPKCPNSAVPFLKMLECASGFENFAKIFRNQDIQMWHNLDYISKIFRSASFFVHFNREFNLSFIETCDLQKSSTTEAQLWIWEPRCLLKGLKVDNLLEESFDLCLDVLPLPSGEIYFWPVWLCFWVAPSTIWSDIHVLNIALSLLLSVKISVLKKNP